MHSVLKWAHFRRFGPKVVADAPVVRMKLKKDYMYAYDEECVTINDIYILTGGTIILIVHSLHRRKSV